ncbi:uncharacterized protein, partial [Triticum aestivum]|uniref:uncharacterized protein n=1 Tax=Triticum aestivum TaxID=4565 RepID=UPI001D02815F
CVVARAEVEQLLLGLTLELKEKLSARDAEVAALREQLESTKGDLTAAKLAAEAVVESARTTAVQQFLASEEHKRRLAEHALAGYERGAEEMKRAVLRIYPHLDAARLVVPLD